MNRPDADRDAVTDPAPPVPLPPLMLRAALGGVLMGMANLVPGISGGTMLLAAGVYPRFIGAIGEITTLKFRKVSMVVLGTVVVAALLSIVLLAGTVKDLVVNHRWAMYALFIGLTLGGVPVVWRLIRAGGRRPGASVWVAALIGFVGMAVLAVYQAAGGGATSANDGFIFMFLAGTAGAAAMILPGVSGGYLLLVLGAYVPILAGIDAFKDALSARDFAALVSVGLAVVLPVGIGVLVGVVGVSNLLKWLLRRFEQATLGVLLGLLIGAVAGLWPFQESVPPDPEMVVKGQRLVEREAGWVFADTLKPVEPEDLPTRWFTPSAAQVGGAVGLIVLGFALTMGVDRLGREKERKTESRA